MFNACHDPNRHILYVCTPCVPIMPRWSGHPKCSPARRRFHVEWVGPVPSASVYFSFSPWSSTCPSRADTQHDIATCCAVRYVNCAERSPSPLGVISGSPICPATLVASCLKRVHPLEAPKGLTRTAREVSFPKKKGPFLSGAFILSKRDKCQCAACSIFAVSL